MRDVTYKDQLIREFGENDVCFYLYGDCGDLIEGKAKSVEEAKMKIDKLYEKKGGFYDAYGELYTY